MKRARVAYHGAVREASVDLAEHILSFEDGSYAAFSEVEWLPPFDAGTVFALGLNYADHAKELSFKAPDKPLVFLKGTASLVGHLGTSACPVDVKQMHPECELAVVIGRRGRKISRDQAFDYIRGYSVANDYALRECLENYYRPNLRVKSRDLCTPIGPWLVDAADISDPMNLFLQTTVNGKVVQDGNTRDMIFSISAIIEYLSEFMTLSPGDVILTGTPTGVQFMKPGDEVTTTVEHVGSLVNTIVAQPVKKVSGLLCNAD